jgi:hypothetical protein
MTANSTELQGTPDSSLTKLERTHTNASNNDQDRAQHEDGSGIARCKKAHPKVRRVDSNTVTVTSSSGSYTVKILTPREGLVLAQCNCQAGLRAQLCYHIPGALVVPPSSSPAPTHHPLAGVLVKDARNVVTIDGWTV